MKHVFPHSRAQKNDLAMSSDKKLTKSLDKYLFFLALSNEHAEKLLHTVSVNEEMKNSRFRLNFIL